jgi:hypothetical protein
MDGTKGIGLSSKFSTSGGGVPSTLHSSTMGNGSSALAGGGGKAKMAALDWRLKVAIVMLIVAFVYATASRFIKTKKGTGGKKEEGKKEQCDDGKDGKDGKPGGDNKK